MKIQEHIDKIKELQDNSNFIILNNPFSNPTFVKKMSLPIVKLGKSQEYPLKLFYEVISNLKSYDLVNMKDNESIKITLQIKKFATSIKALNNNNFYTDIKNAAHYLLNTNVTFKDVKGLSTTLSIFTKIKTDEKGKLVVFMDAELAQVILNVQEKGNFSFLKEYLFELQNSQAIKLYPFFKSWANFGKFESTVDNFKKLFGFDTSGYDRFSKLELRVLIPAMKEINEKTDIMISYSTLGENLDSLRPKVKGIIFNISMKDKMLPPNAQYLEDVEQLIVMAGVSTEDEKIMPQKQNVLDDLPDNQVLYSLMDKFTINTNPDPIDVQNKVDNLVREGGYEAVKQGLLDLLASNPTNIKGLSFFTMKTLLANKGLSTQKKVAKTEKIAEVKVKVMSQKDKDFIYRIEQHYQRDKDAHYQKIYENLSENEKNKHLKTIWEQEKNKQIFFNNGQIKSPNNYAIDLVGEKITFPNGYNHQESVRNYALINFKAVIDFDKEGKILLMQRK
jgi:hypothetical protein